MKSDNKLKKLISEIRTEAKKSNRETAFVIITNVKKTNSLINFLPKRKTDQLVCGVVSVYSLSLVKEILLKIDGKVNYLFIDSEQKVNGLEKLLEYVIKNIKTTKIIPFKSSDSTVNSTDSLLMELLSCPIGKKISIIGAGNIGSKVALKLIERGFIVNIAKRKFEKTQKIANAINLLKPKFCKGKIIAKKFSNVAKNCDVLIGFTNEIPIISSKMVSQMNKNGIILDGGIGNIQNNVFETAEKRNIMLLRLDIRTGFAADIELFYQTRNLLQNIMGKIDFKNYQIIAGGVYGKNGDIVVDNIKDPTKLIGICDGKGGISSLKPSNELQLRLNEVKVWISDHRKGIRTFH